MILTRIIKAAVTLTADKRKIRRLKKIDRRRNAESLLNLSGVIRLGSDNLMIFVKLIIRLRRFYPSLAVGPRDHIVKRRDVYLVTFLPITILIKILILAF